MSKQSEKKESDKTVVHVQVSKVEKAQIAKHAEALGVSSAELFRRGAQLAAFTHPSFWELLIFLSERSSVPLWDIAYISAAEMFAQFQAEEMNFLKPKTIDHLQKLHRVYNKDRSVFIKRRAREWSLEFNKTRASERNGL